MDNSDGTGQQLGGWENWLIDMENGEKQKITVATRLSCYQYERRRMWHAAIMAWVEMQMLSRAS